MSNVAEFDEYVARNQRFRRYLFRGGIVLACLLVVIVADYLRRVERQHSAVVDLKRRGVMVIYDRVDQHGDPVSPHSQPVWQHDLFENDWLGSPSAVNAFYSYERLDDGGIEQLCKLASLKVLLLHRASLSGRRLESLICLSNLRTLSIEAASIEDAELVHLRRFRRLSKLGLAHTAITDDGLDAIAEMPNLTLIDLSGTFVSSEGVARLQKVLPNARIIWKESPSREHALACNKIMQAGGSVRPIKVWGDPTRMGIGVTIFRKDEDPYGAGYLVWRGSQDDSALLPDIQGLSTLFVEPDLLGPDKWKVLLACLDLNALHFKGGTITDDDLARIPEMPALTHLYLEGSPISDDGLSHLRECRQLQGLGLSRTGITDQGLAALEALTALKSLRLTGTAVSDPGVSSLKGLSNLTYLDLSKTNVGDSGLAELVGLSQLETLNVEEAKVTDAGLESVAKLKMLKYIRLRNNKGVSLEGIRRLQANCPKLSVSQ